MGFDHLHSFYIKGKIRLLSTIYPQKRFADKI